MCNLGGHTGVGLSQLLLGLPLLYNTLHICVSLRVTVALMAYLVCLVTKDTG